MSQFVKRRGVSWIRLQQRIVTAVFPHNANRTHIIPNRGKDLATGEPVAGATLPQP